VCGESSLTKQLQALTWTTPCSTRLESVPVNIIAIKQVHPGIKNFATSHFSVMGNNRMFCIRYCDMAIGAKEEFSFDSNFARILAIFHSNTVILSS
jgi:hypothetical protein